MTERQAFSTDSQFERAFGYSRAVRQGAFVFCAGCTGYDYATHSISPDIEEQTRQCFKNAEAALAMADAKLTDVVRVVLYVSDERYMETAGRMMGEIMDGCQFVATGVVAGLVNSDILVEIEVTALDQED